MPRADERKSFTVTVGAINHAPSFASTGNIAVADESGPQSFASYVSAVSAGPPEDVGQAVQLVVTVIGSGLFLVPPSLDATGKLTFPANAESRMGQPRFPFKPGTTVERSMAASMLAPSKVSPFWSTSLIPGTIQQRP